MSHVQRWPSDAEMVVYIMDSEHAGDVDKLIEATKNPHALEMLVKWRDRLKRVPFIVIGGRMHLADAGGVTGGLAASWEGALALFDFVWDRFAEIAQAQGREFSTAFIPQVTDERRRDIESRLAQRQHVGGHA